MTEVPEHLLQRSRERRAALGLGGEGGGDAPAAESVAAATPADEAQAGGVPATTAPAPAVPVAAPPAVVEPAPVPVPAYVAAALTRPKIPRFALPVLAILPLWALIYAGVLTEPGAGEFTDPVLAEGAEVYAAQCSGCHAANGSGGTGRALNAGEVIQTFPEAQAHIDWVVNGSPEAGTPYGAPDRPGGQRISQSDGFGEMPAFGEALTEEEIIAVVRYEREFLGGETESSLAAGGGLDAQEGANTNEEGAENLGGNVGGEGGSGSSSDASPGGGDGEDDADQIGDDAGADTDTGGG